MKIALLCQIVPTKDIFAILLEIAQYQKYVFSLPNYGKRNAPLGSC